MTECTQCHGSGKIDCPVCDGTGYDGREFCTACDTMTNSGGQPVPSGKVACPSCDGKGQR